ncbi:MAG: hypothetical protein CMI16_07225 [Opitutaceae bacterium]|nr:hypothetical protein [Opitutaceae bacterium]|tara:strand:- start:1871 stop:2353 length:483 start_codon:yes stop_codon:yes gene_type:complete
MMMLRKHPVTANAIIVVCPESNLGFEACHIERFVRECALNDVVVMHEDVHNRPGIRTTHDTKEIMHGLLRDCLANDGLRTSRDLVASDGKAETHLKELETQMGSYAIIVEPGSTSFAKARRTYSGKSGGSQDDLIISLQLCFLARSVFWQHSDQKYQQWV